MQAIVSKYLGPTDYKGSRVKAWCDAGSVTVDWDYALNVEENHRAAAEALQAKLGWTDHALIAGGLPERGINAAYVFVLVRKAED